MKKIRLFLAVICVVFCLATTAYVAQSTPVLAASSTTSSKIDASKLKIKLSATKYNYNGRERKPKVSVTYKGKTVSADNFTVKYSSGRKLPGTYKVTVTLKGKYTGKKTLKYKIAVETPDVKVASGTNSIKLSWEKSAKAKGYFVYNEDGDRVAKTEKTTYTVKNLKAGRRYTFYVVAYTKIGDKTYKSSDAVIETATKPVISGSKTLYIGQNKTFKATAKGKISWSSSDKSIAKVNSEGKVTALKAGTVTIKAKANGVTASYKVTIKKPTIKLNKSYLELDINESAKLKATVTPSSMKVKWKSSDADIVEVYSNGEIVPISEGDAIVTAIGTYGGKTYKKTCEVLVVSDDESGFDILASYMEEYGYESKNGNKYILTTDEIGNNEDTFVIYYDSYKDSFEFYALSECNVDDGIGESVNFFVDRSSVVESVEGIVVHYVDGDVAGSGGAIADLDLNTYSQDTKLEFEWQPGTTNYIRNSDGDTFNSFLQFAFIKWEQLIYDACGIYMSDLGFVAY